MKTVRRRVFEIVDVPPGMGLDAFDVFIMVLIVLNAIAVALGTVESIASRCAQLFTWFERFSIGVFTVEYVLRVYSCTEYPNYRHPLSGRVRFIFTPLALVDLAAILPFYLPMLVVDLRFLRLFRLLRFIRLLKIVRYSDSLRILGNVIHRKKQELVMTAVVTAVFLFIASSVIYLVEKEAQPAQFSSIPAAMWWGVVTLTTIGYGDVYPVTTAGKVIGSLVAFLGIGLFALPAGIIASGLVQEAQKNGGSEVCPHCGKPLREPHD